MVDQVPGEIVVVGPRLELPSRRLNLRLGLRTLLEQTLVLPVPIHLEQTHLREAGRTQARIEHGRGKQLKSILSKGLRETNPEQRIEDQLGSKPLEPSLAREEPGHAQVEQLLRQPEESRAPEVVAPCA